MTLFTAVAIPIGLAAQDQEEHNTKQLHYSVTDLGTLKGGNFSCAMGLNNQGWTEVMDTLGDESSGNMLLRARATISGVKIDLGTLGGPNSWINWGGINEPGAAVGYAETSAPDPNGEDYWSFGAHLTCRPFLWQDGRMTALPTLGGNNGQASAINRRGQVTGEAENTTPDSTCTAPQVFQSLPVLWEAGQIHELATVSGDPDGFAFGINDLGQAAGYSGTCIASLHAVLWENGAAVELPNLGSLSNNVAYAINNQGQVVGNSSPNDTTFYAVLWQNGVVTNLGTIPGDFASFATGINNKGQVVGSSLDANFNLVHAFLWEKGVMTDLSTLFPAGFYLYPTMANEINSVGQISGMATVVSGPDAGDIHAFLATPVDPSTATADATLATPGGTSQAPKVILPDNVRKLVRQSLGFGRFGAGSIKPQ